MKRRIIQPDAFAFPEVFRPLLKGAAVYDSSCSPEARVYFIDKDEGIYLKSAPAGTLARESVMTEYLHRKGLATEVLAYHQVDRDWLLTRAVAGEDCTHADYLADPKRLSEMLGILLRKLHSIDPSDCPIDHTSGYLAAARKNIAQGNFDPSMFPEAWRCASREDAIRLAEEGNHLLKSDTLLHGDYCLPNIMLKDWNFSGFIDVGNGGIGDRHIDLFWGIWSLGFNLKTDAYCDRFLDAYGREDVDIGKLRILDAFETYE